MAIADLVAVILASVASLYFTEPRPQGAPMAYGPPKVMKNGEIPHC
jgi:hypothetical protein